MSVTSGAGTCTSFAAATAANFASCRCGNGAKVARHRARVTAGMFAVGWGANQFSSLLVAYRDQRGISTAINDGLFGSYAVALIIALLLSGPAADRWGRESCVPPCCCRSSPACC